MMISKNEIDVRYNETDQMGVVYHANYLIWFELGREHFLSVIGFNYQDLENRNLIFPVREVNIQYINACRYGEKLVIETKVKEFNSVKTIYSQTIKNTNNVIKAKALITVICVRKDNFKIVKLEKHAKDVFDAYTSLS